MIERKRRKSLLYILLNIFSFLIVLVYAVGGVILYFSPNLLPGYPDNVRKIIGGFLFVYGVIRIIRLARKFNKIENVSEDVE